MDEMQDKATMATTHTDDRVADTSVPMMLTSAEAAVMAGVSVRTIRRWIEQGHLPAKPTASGWRISSSDLNAGTVFASPQPRTTRQRRQDHDHKQHTLEPASAGSGGALQRLEVLRDTVLAPFIEQNERQQQKITEQTEEIGRLVERVDQQRMLIVRLEEKLTTGTHLEDELKHVRSDLERLDRLEQQIAEFQLYAGLLAELERHRQRPWWRFWE